MPFNYTVPFNYIYPLPSLRVMHRLLKPLPLDFRLLLLRRRGGVAAWRRRGGVAWRGVAARRGGVAGSEPLKPYLA